MYHGVNLINILNAVAPSHKSNLDEPQLQMSAIISSFNDNIISGNYDNINNVTYSYNVQQFGIRQRF